MRTECYEKLFIGQKTGKCYILKTITFIFLERQRKKMLGEIIYDQKTGESGNNPLFGLCISNFRIQKITK